MHIPWTYAIVSQHAWYAESLLITYTLTHDPHGSQHCACKSRARFLVRYSPLSFWSSCQIFASALSFTHMVGTRPKLTLNNQSSTHMCPPHVWRSVWVHVSDKKRTRQILWDVIMCWFFLRLVVACLFSILPAGYHLHMRRHNAMICGVPVVRIAWFVGTDTRATVRE